VRLAGVHREGELEALLHAEKARPEPKPPERPQPGDEPKPGSPRRPSARAKRKAPIPSEVRKHYEAAPGYANYWFNRYHQQRIWNAYLAHGDFAETGWNWKITAKTAGTNRAVEIDLTEKNGSIVMPDGQSGVEFGASLMNATGPPRSGGLLAALHVWQRLLLVGPRKFGEVYYLGPMPWKSDDALADCLVATHAGVETRFYFDPEKSNLVGIEFFASDDDDDPCEITFADIRPVDGRSLPHHWTIRLGDDLFADLNVASYEFGKAHTGAKAEKAGKN